MGYWTLRTSQENIISQPNGEARLQCELLYTMIGRETDSRLCVETRTTASSISTLHGQWGDFVGLVHRILGLM